MYAINLHVASTLDIETTEIVMVVSPNIKIPPLLALDLIIIRTADDMAWPGVNESPGNVHSIMIPRDYRY